MNIKEFETKALEIHNAQMELNRIKKEKTVGFWKKTFFFLHSLYRTGLFQIHFIFCASTVESLLIPAMNFLISIVRTGLSIFSIFSVFGLFVLMGFYIFSLVSLGVSFFQYSINFDSCFWRNSFVKEKAEKFSKFMTGDLKIEIKKKVKPLTREQQLKQIVKEGKTFIGAFEQLKDADFRKGLKKLLEGNY